MEVYNLSAVYERRLFMFLIADTSGRHDVIPAHKIFSNEADKVAQLCQIIFHYGLYGNDKCYKAPHPGIAELRKFATKWNVNLFAAMRRWQEENVPQELAKQRASEAENTANYEKALRHLYGIAKRHHLWIKWYCKGCTCCCPDQFEIMRGGKSIGRIHLM